MKNYITTKNEIIKYKKDLINKFEIIGLSKYDVSEYKKQELLNIVKNKIGKTPLIFSSLTKVGINKLIKELFNQCYK